MFWLRATATHIVGGEMTYRYLGSNQYEIKLKLYIDCFNGNPSAIAQDAYANVAIFEGDSGKYLPSLCQSILRDAPVRVSKTNYNCIKISPNACVDAYEYVKTVTLPPVKGGYYLSFQRCCRNNTIINIINPLSTGENIWTKINDTTDIGFNSSPEFKNLPPNFLCTNAPLVFDHSATDADGDSLVYEFFQPYTGATSPNPRPECNQYQNPPFTQIQFESVYSYYDAIPSSPTVSLNKRTGELKITPTLQGQFVVGIVVKEYRKGILIGYTQRDYQFNVQNCVFETTSAFVNPSVNCNREVFFTNNSQNADAYRWEFGDSTTLADTSVAKDGYYRYPKPGSYLVRLRASKGNCVDSISKLVTVFDRINFKLPKDTVICRGTSLVLKPDTFYYKGAYLWNTGSLDTTLPVNTAGTYWLNVTIGNCNSYDTVNIVVDNQIIDLLSDSLVCDPQTYELKAILQMKGSYNDVEWSSNALKIPNSFKDSILPINKKGTYVVKGLNLNNCPFSDSVSIKGADIQQQFKTPNVFTPNGDAYNDYFPAEKAAYRYHLTVFDRWGLQVHKAHDVPWSAAGFPTGVYYYFIEMEACGFENTLHGVVQVIR